MKSNNKDKSVVSNTGEGCKKGCSSDIQKIENTFLNEYKEITVFEEEVAPARAEDIFNT